MNQIKMKKKILVVLYIFLLPFFIIEAKENLSIDLIKDCSKEECKPRIWYVIDSFEENYLDLLRPSEV